MRLLAPALLVAALGCKPDTNPKAVRPAIEAYERGDHARAVTLLDAYLADYPKHVDAWVVLGNAHEALDQDDRARAAYERALAVDAKSYKALTGLGILARKQKDYAGAMRRYEQAVALQPDYAEAWSSMAVVALKLEQDARAVEYAEKAWKLDGKNGQFAANLAIAYHYAGRERERDDLIAQAQRLGYPNMESLRKIVAGDLTVRD